MTHHTAMNSNVTTCGPMLAPNILTAALRCEHKSLTAAAIIKKRIRGAVLQQICTLWCVGVQIRKPCVQMFERKCVSSPSWPHLSKGVSSGPGDVAAPAADARTGWANGAARCTRLLLRNSGCCAGLPMREAAARRGTCGQNAARV